MLPRTVAATASIMFSVWNLHKPSLAVTGHYQWEGGAIQYKLDIDMLRIVYTT